ncbi:MAG: hypothetical protein JNM91_02810 [Flavobacteriales bacterium]|nr:hypothetical protein [Flavobacteriales bacterium]
MLRKHLSLIACSLLLLAACKKDEDSDPIDVDYSSASDNARAEDAFSDMLTQVDNAVAANGLRGTDDECAPVVTFDTLSNPRTLTIDFGTVNCTANNGRLRRGRILVSYTGRYRDAGTVITLTPENYYVNDNHVQGTKTVTNLGLNSDGHLHYAVQVNGSLTAGDGSWTSTHQASRTRTWIEGENTAILNDDVYLISGGGSGVNRNGVAYTVSITNALRVAVGCPFITQGTLQITPEGRPVRAIDYGNGSCDGTFTVSVNGQSFTVTIG